MNTKISDRARHQIAQETARIMVEEWMDDYHLAKVKAAEKLGLGSIRNLPTNREVEDAIEEYRRLFHGEREDARLRRQREAALQAMRMLAQFQPRLTGPVLSGNAHEQADIHLHLFTDTHEEVAWFLMDRGIPYQLKDRVYHSIGRSYPSYRFFAGDDRIVLIVFQLLELRHAPPSPVDGKPTRRADLAAVENLLKQTV